MLLCNALGASNDQHSGAHQEAQSKQALQQCRDMIHFSNNTSYGTALTPNFGDDRPQPS